MLGVLVGTQGLLHAASHHDLLLRHLRLDWQLSFAAERTVQAISAGEFMLNHLIGLLLVWWTIEEGLTIDSPSLFQLLFELVRDNLLADHGLASLLVVWTVVLGAT